MSSKWPCITAIVNTYMRPDLLPRALDSVLAQTFKDFELLIAYDGPLDLATKDICVKYTDAFLEQGIDLDVVALDENTGAQATPKNAATYAARGDYIAYLDDDNEWLPQHLEKLVEAIEEGTLWPDFTYGRRIYTVDPGFNGMHKGKELFTGESPFQPWNDEAKARLAASPTFNFIDSSDLLIAKGALWRLQLATEMMWNEGYRRFGDWELVCRATHFAGWRGKAIDEVLTRYHWHGKNIQLTRPAQELPVGLKSDDYIAREAKNSSVHPD